MTQLLENKTREHGIRYQNCLTGKEMGFNTAYFMFSNTESVY